MSASQPRPRLNWRKPRTGSSQSEIASEAAASSQQTVVSVAIVESDAVACEQQQQQQQQQQQVSVVPLRFGMRSDGLPPTIVSVTAGTDSEEAGLSNCIVCGCSLQGLPVSARERHVNDCVDARAGAGDAELPVPSDSAVVSCIEDRDITALPSSSPDARCMVCGKDLEHMTVARRTQHINRCLDERIRAAAATESRPSPKRSIAQVLLDDLACLSWRRLSCVVCARALDACSAAARVSHLRLCAESHAIDPDDLLARLRSLQAQPEQAAAAAATAGAANSGGGGGGDASGGLANRAAGDAGGGPVAALDAPTEATARARRRRVQRQPRDTADALLVGLAVDASVRAEARRAEQQYLQRVAQSLLEPVLHAQAALHQPRDSAVAPVADRLETAAESGAGEGPGAAATQVMPASRFGPRRGASDDPEGGAPAAAVAAHAPAGPAPAASTTTAAPVPAQAAAVASAPPSDSLWAWHTGDVPLPPAPLRAARTRTTDAQTQSEQTAVWAAVGELMQAVEALSTAPLPDAHADAVVRARCAAVQRAQCHLLQWMRLIVCQACDIVRTGRIGEQPNDTTMACTVDALAASVLAAERAAAEAELPPSPPAPTAPVIASSLSQADSAPQPAASIAPTAVQALLELPQPTALPQTPVRGDRLCPIELGDSPDTPAVRRTVGAPVLAAPVTPAGGLPATLPVLPTLPPPRRRSPSPPLARPPADVGSQRPRADSCPLSPELIPVSSSSASAASVAGGLISGGGGGGEPDDAETMLADGPLIVYSPPHTPDHAHSLLPALPVPPVLVPSGTPSPVRRPPLMPVPSTGSAAAPPGASVSAPSVVSPETMWRQLDLALHTSIPTPTGAPRPRVPRPAATQPLVDQPVSLSQPTGSIASTAAAGACRRLRPVALVPPASGGRDDPPLPSASDQLRALEALSAVTSSRRRARAHSPPPPASLPLPPPASRAPTGRAGRSRTTPSVADAAAAGAAAAAAAAAAPAAPSAAAAGAAGPPNAAGVDGSSEPIPDFPSMSLDELKRRMAALGLRAGSRAYMIERLTTAWRELQRPENSQHLAVLQRVEKQQLAKRASSAITDELAVRATAALRASPLWDAVLLYEPLDLHQTQATLAAAGYTLPLAAVAAYLSAQGVAVRRPAKRTHTASASQPT